MIRGRKKFKGKMHKNRKGRMLGRGASLGGDYHFVQRNVRCVRGEKRNQEPEKRGLLYKENRQGLAVSLQGGGEVSSKGVVRKGLLSLVECIRGD